jgi:hypothetical protein
MNPKKFLTASLVAASFSLGASRGFAQTTWDTGGGTDKTRTALTNWSTDADPSNRALVFGATGLTSNARTIGNMPEPGAGAMVGAGMGMLMVWQRKRRKA